MHLYIIRHADPCYDPDSLTETGHKEAAALAPRMKDFGINYIYSSPMIRAKQTAFYTANLQGLEIIEKEWLKELSHIHINQNGKEYTIWDTFGETIRKKQPLPGHKDWYLHPPFDKTKIGELWQNFRIQVDRFISEHGYTREDGRYRIDRSNDDRIAIFCHNGTLLLFLAHLLEIPPSMVWSGFYCWPSSVTDIYFDERSDEWAVPRALHVADVSHLIANGLKPQARGMGDRCDEYY
jgi:probable phosphoglycerate mutase